ncbi:MAG: hypothetical protein WC662_00560 [Candidatus Paceibacterota bacterium]|jgi:hypothetical protein
MNDIYKILEFTSKSHKQPVYLLNGVDKVKIKMISPATISAIKYANGENGIIGLEADIYLKTLKIGKEITKEQYENNNLNSFL